MASHLGELSSQVSPPASASASAARRLASSASSSELARALLSRIQVLEEQVMKTSDKLMQGMVRDTRNHFSECQSTLTDAVVRTQWKCAMASAAFLSLLAMLSAYFTKA